MKTRVLVLLLALVMLVGLLPTVALAADAAEASVIEIGSADDLKAFRDRVNKGETKLNAKLTADIDLGDEEWIPIGLDYSASFNGTFDGNEKTISGLKIAMSSGEVAGLFGMTNGATIKKLVVKGSVSMTAASTAYSPAVGGVVGQSDGNVTMEEVASYVDVTCINSTSNTAMAGGLFGNGYNVTIKNCANYGTLKAEGTGKTNIGGLCGMSEYGAAATIENSMNVGEIIGGNTVGGLLSAMKADYSNRTPNIKNSATVGEIVGSGTEGTIENCFATSNKINAADVTVVSDMKDAQVLTALGDAFKAGKDGVPILSWIKEDTEEPEEPEVPIPDENDVYQIATETQLKWFRDQVNSGKGNINAKLMNDIVLTEDWTPIGIMEGYNAKAFTGVFDGQQHEITGLKIDCTASDSVALGLFGVASNATIKNLVVRGEVKATLADAG